MKNLVKSTLRAAAIAFLLFNTIVLTVPALLIALTVRTVKGRSHRIQSRKSSELRLLIAGNETSANIQEISTLLSRASTFKQIGVMQFNEHPFYKIDDLDHVIRFKCFTIKSSDSLIKNISNESILIVKGKEKLLINK